MTATIFLHHHLIYSKDVSFEREQDDEQEQTPSSKDIRYLTYGSSDNLLSEDVLLYPLKSKASLDRRRSDYGLPLKRVRTSRVGQDSRLNLESGRSEKQNERQNEKQNEKQNERQNEKQRERQRSPPSPRRGGVGERGRNIKKKKMSVMSRMKLDDEPLAVEPSFVAYDLTLQKQDRIREKIIQELEDIHERVEKVRNKSFR